MVALHPSASTFSSRVRAAEILAGVLLVVALIFGGGSRGTGDLVVHLAAAIAFPFALARLQWHSLSTVAKWTLVGFVLAALLIASQLIALPVDAWARLAPRAEVLSDLNAAVSGNDRSMPISLDRYGTIRAALWLLVGFTAWASIINLEKESQVRILKVLVGVGVGMALLGFYQAAAGNQPTFRVYEFRNEFGATGLFANRNHFGMLMAMLAVVATGIVFRESRGSKPAVIWLAAIACLLLAATLSFSRAAGILAIFGMGAAVLGGFALQSTKEGSWKAFASFLVVGCVVAVGVATYSWTNFAARFEKNPLDDMRFQYFQFGQDALKAYLPWGSGLGSFPDVYAPFEPVQKMVTSYALHAHNDYLEVATEAGVFGIALMVFALVIVGASGVRTLRKVHGKNSVKLACFVAIILPILHSIGDYPLRTLAVWSITAALLAVVQSRTNDLSERAEGSKNA